MIAIFYVRIRLLHCFHVGHVLWLVAAEIAQQVVLSIGAGDTFLLFDHWQTVRTDMRRQLFCGDGRLDLSEGVVIVFNIIFSNF